MLVLSRKKNEEITMTVQTPSGPIVITLVVVRIGPGTVRLAFDAPRDVPIVRSELTAQTDRAA
ncbi:MAG: carbon storage regulator [Phycisphaerales bacterium]|nr:carbon storage regulator [Phycisphaerales bacterium]